MTVSKGMALLLPPICHSVIPYWSCLLYLHTYKLDNRGCIVTFTYNVTSTCFVYWVSKAGRFLASILPFENMFLSVEDQLVFAPKVHDV